MVEVRIRSEYASKSVRLMDWPADRLDHIVPLLAMNGVLVDDFNDDEIHAQGRFGTQFVVTDTAAYFEVICLDGSDA